MGAHFSLCFPQAQDRCGSSVIQIAGIEVSDAQRLPLFDDGFFHAAPSSAP
ncbi:hypothetical protein [Xanthomonas bromi]|uniref:hypothetical protein n=1 Tax=Xanthomonas bromi TaxID=56449 RepID=UPI0015E46004|nr:hypothetical protein [Xanthomonas bromi]